MSCSKNEKRREAREGGGKGGWAHRSGGYHIAFWWLVFIGTHTYTCAHLFCEQGLFQEHSASFRLRCQQQPSRIHRRFTELSHAYKWVTSQMYECCHTYECVMSHTNMTVAAAMHTPPCLWVESYHTYGCESCHMQMSHMTRANALRHTRMGPSHLRIHRCFTESCHTYQRVKSHVWMRHITYEWVTSRMNESRHTWMCYVTHEWVRRSCEYVVRCTLQRTATHCNILQHTPTNQRRIRRIRRRFTESCHTQECIQSHIWMSHVTYE